MKDITIFRCFKNKDTYKGVLAGLEKSSFVLLNTKWGKGIIEANKMSLFVFDKVSFSKLEFIQTFPEITELYLYTSKLIKITSSEEYKLLNPEKAKAQKEIRKIYHLKSNPENELHHWSYKEQHVFDVLELTKEEHSEIHKWITYKQPLKMYFGRYSFVKNNINGKYEVSSGILLNTKEKHLAFFISLYLFQKEKLLDRVNKLYDLSSRCFGRWSSQ